MHYPNEIASQWSLTVKRKEELPGTIDRFNIIII